MVAEQIVLSRELSAVLRRAVAYAFDAGSEFVQAEHLRQALRDDDTTAWAKDALPASNDPLLLRIAESIQREQGHAAQIATTRAWPPVQRHDPDSEGAPFPVYDSLFIRTPDGNAGKWLDQDSYNIFLKGARNARGAYLPKHLAQAL